VELEPPSLVGGVVGDLGLLPQTVLVEVDVVRVERGGADLQVAEGLVAQGLGQLVDEGGAVGAVDDAVLGLVLEDLHRPNAVQRGVLESLKGPIADGERAEEVVVDPPAVFPLADHVDVEAGLDHVGQGEAPVDLLVLDPAIVDPVVGGDGPQGVAGHGVPEASGLDETEDLGAGGEVFTVDLQVEGEVVGDPQPVVLVVGLRPLEGELQCDRPGHDGPAAVALGVPLLRSGKELEQEAPELDALVVEAPGQGDAHGLRARGPRTDGLGLEVETDDDGGLRHSELP